jgi:hypothetical protein
VQKALPQAEIVHTSRNFGKLLKWARDNAPGTGFDLMVYVTDNMTT